MNQTLRKFLPIAVIPSLVLIIQCANPVDEPPLRWENKNQVPISNKNFYLKEEFDNMFSLDSITILDKHPAEKDSGDTMIFSIHRSSSDTFETSEDSLEDQREMIWIGPVPISGVPQLQKNGTLPPAQGTFTVPLTITLDSIYNVTFYDTVLNRVPIAFTNSSTATITNLIINAGTLGADTLQSIGAGITDTAWIHLGGKQSNGTVAFTVSGSKSAGAGTFTLSMNVNGLTASSISVNDHLVQISREVIVSYEITDTVDIEYVDIADGKFLYSIDNYSGLSFSVLGNHEHLWSTPYCILTNRLKIADLVAIPNLDSNSYYAGSLNAKQTDSSGNTVTLKIPVEQNTKTDLAQSISAYRLFPHWDSTKQESVTDVRYSISSKKPVGDTLTINALDSIVFTIKAPGFKFKEFLGTSMEEYNHTGDTQKIFIDVPWPQDSQDSLRGKFVLSNVDGDVHVTPGMPDSAFIDSMEIHFIAFSPESLSVKSLDTVTFTNVNKDSTFERTIDLTNVSNLFPDTLYVTANTRIPKGTRMKVVNDLVAPDPSYAKLSGRMTTSFNTDYFLNSDLDWEILDTVHMDLGSAIFEVPQELRYVRKLEEKQASFLLSIENHTNLNMKLYGLLAPQAYIDALDSINGNELTFYLNNPDSAKGHGFINFIDGLFIPLRDSTHIDTITWTNEELDQIVSSDSCRWRWQIRFFPKTRDALKDVDYMRINSAFRVEGVNNMDSLMMW